MSDTLILHLKKEYYDMVISGKKRVEFRECKPYWDKRFANKYEHIMFVLGYKFKHARIYKIDKIKKIPYYDLPKYAQKYFVNTNCSRFYAIYFYNLPCR